MQKGTDNINETVYEAIRRSIWDSINYPSNSVTIDFTWDVWDSIVDMVWHEVGSSILESN